MFLYTIPKWLPLLLIPLMLFLHKIREIRRQNKLLPPGPPRLPLLGNLHQLGALPHKSLSQLSTKYGPVILIKLGRIPIVVISSAEAAREVLKVHDLDCCSRPLLAGTRKISYNYLDVALAPYGECWREMRKLFVLELLSPRRVQSFRLIREDEVASVMNSISESSASETPVDLSEKAYALNISIVIRMAFGKRYEGKSSDDKKFKKLIQDAEAVVGSFSAEECFPYVGWIVDRLTGCHEKFERVFHELDDFFEQIINDHVKPERENPEHEDIVDVMLKLERDQHQADQSGHGVQLTRDHIKAMVMNVFLGGVETNSITIIWAMAELVKNPRLIHKAQEEVRNCIGNKGRVTEADLDQLLYLKMVIKETLRLHPPAPLLIAREAMSCFKVNGYKIYPKTLIQVNAWAIGRDPKYWKNPKEFFPERFMDNSIDFYGQHFEYLPFGSGRRGCPGINMGLVTVELALANLLYCFDWKLPYGMEEDDLDMGEAVGVSVSLSKSTPLSLVPVKYVTLV